MTASPLWEFSLAKASNRRFSEWSVAAFRIAVSSFLVASGSSECSVAASGIADDVALREEPGKE